MDDRHEEHREQCPLCERSSLRWVAVGESSYCYECSDCGKFAVPDVMRCWHCGVLCFAARMATVARCNQYGSREHRYCSERCQEREAADSKREMSAATKTSHRVAKWRAALAAFVGPKIKRGE